VAPRKRAAIYNAPEQQVGEQQITAAGGDIVHGIDPAMLERHLDAERKSRDLMAEMLERLWRRIDAMEGERRRDAEDAARERGIDFEARLKRQGLLDTDLAVIRWWLVALTVAWAVGIVAWALLAWRVFVPPFDAAALLRLWLGAALALAAQLWRRV
jgi:hypothetical protein